MKTNKEGFIGWRIKDDDGKQVTHDTNSYLNLVTYLMCHVIWSLQQQHWLHQKAKDLKPNPRGTWSGMYHDCIELWWNQCKYKCTISLDLNEMNVGMIMTSLGYE